MSTVIADLLVKIGVETKEAKSAAKNVESVQTATKKLEKEGGRALDNFAGKFVITAGDIANAISSVIKGAVQGLWTFLDEGTDRLDKISKQSQQLGIGTEEFQRLGYAAELSGTSIETVGKASKKLQAGLLDARMGGKGLQLALDELGIAVKDIEGKSLTEQLGIISNELGLVTDEAERSAIAARLFGEEAGPQLVPLLNEGSEGINKLTAGAKGIADDETIANSVAFRDQLTEFYATLEEIKVAMLSELIPAAREIIKWLQGWSAENKSLIATGLEKYISYLGTIIQGIVAYVDMAIEHFTWLYELWLKFATFIADTFRPAWDGIKTGIEAVVGPIDVIYERITNITQAIKDFVAQSETLLGLARSLGISSLDPSKGENLAGTGSLVSFFRGNERRAQEAASPQARQEQRSSLTSSQLQNREHLLMKLKTGKSGKALTKAEARNLSNLIGASSDIPDYQKQQIIADATKNSYDPNAPKTARGGGGKAVKKEEEKEVQLTSFEQLLGSTLGPGFELKQLDAVRQVKVKEDIKPEAVVNITNNTFTISQTINGKADAKEIGEMSAAAIKKEFDIRLARAGQASQTNVVR